MDDPVTYIVDTNDCTECMQEDFFTNPLPHFSLPGVLASNPSGEAGAEGPLTSDLARNSWLHPRVLQAILRHIRAVYKAGRDDVARQMVAEYIDILDTFQNQGILSPIAEYSPDEVPGDEDPDYMHNENSHFSAEQELELVGLRSDLEAIAQAIDADLDYMGNPKGWVPLLSFEASLTAFQNEIDRAVRVLYLHHFITEKANDLASRRVAVDGMQAALDEEYNDSADLLGNLQIKVANLKIQSTNVMRDIADLRDDVAIRAVELRRLARENVAAEKDLPFWEKGLKTISTIASVTPGFQPGGAALDSLMEFDDNDPLGSTFDGVDAYAGAAQSNIADHSNSITVAVKAKKDPSEISPEELAGAIGEVRNDLVNMRRGISEVSDMWNETVSEQEINAELERLLARDSKLADLIDDLKELNVKKIALANDIVATTQELLKVTARLPEILVAVKSLNEWEQNNAFVLNPEALAYLDQMRDRQFDRLDQYHYLLSRAYEYRVLRPYTPELNLTELVQKFEDIATANGDGSLTQDNMNTLLGVYEANIANITADILTNFDTAFTGTGQFILSPAQLRTLDEQGRLTINLVEDGGEFNSTQENIRIVDVGIFPIMPQLINDGPSDPIGASFNMLLVHSGETTIRRRGEFFRFTHNRSEGEDNPIIWAAQYEFDPLPGEDPLTQNPLSGSTVSLLTTLLEFNVNPRDIEFYSQPAAWGDMTIHILPPDGVTYHIEFSSDDPNITPELRLGYTYDYQPRVIASQRWITVEISNEDILPLTVVETGGDINMRDHGRGGFRRIFVDGTDVTLDAEPMYESWAFDHWEIRGTGTPMQIVDTPKLEIHLTKDEFLRAVYKNLTPGRNAVLLWEFYD